MNQTKHTPGPWKAVLHDGKFFPSVIIGKQAHKDYYNIINQSDPQDVVTCEANAKLIAAAPEILEALVNLKDQVVKDCSIGSDPKFYDMLEKVQDALQAIKKATV